MIINICDTTLLVRTNQTQKEFRKQVTMWLSYNYLNKSYINSETGLEIFINKKGIEKIVSSFGDVKAHASTSIPELIKNASFIRAEDDNRNRPDFIILIFTVLAEVKGDVYEARLYIRQIKERNYLYSLNIAAQKKL